MKPESEGPSSYESEHPLNFENELIEVSNLIKNEPNFAEEELMEKYIPEVNIEVEECVPDDGSGIYQTETLHNHIFITYTETINAGSVAPLKPEPQHNIASHVSNNPPATTRLPNQCPRCHKIYPDERKLKRHYRRYHNRAKITINCEVCNKTFARKDNLAKHMTLHTEKPFPCDQCHKKFSVKYRLKQHLLIYHAEEKPVRMYNCTMCDASYTRNDSLARHLKRFHGDEGSITVIICKICEKPIREYLYNKHVRQHTNEKPKCEVCGKSFSDEQILKRHMRIHTGVKPYPCKLCTYRARHTNSLKLHMTNKHPDNS